VELKVPRIRLAPEPQGRLRFLTKDELVRPLAACEARATESPVLLPVVTVAVDTEMRKGEILGLTWERVDFARGVLGLEQTKSGRRRETYMDQAVDAALSSLAGPKIEDFRFHDLRHTFASHFMMSTGDLPTLQKILGHATLAMTMRYGHVGDDHARKRMNPFSFSSKSAHGDRIGAERLVSTDAPVAQVDRAAVS
jgi:integrase